MKKKGIITVFVILLVALLVLSALVVAENSKVETLKSECTKDIFSDVSALSERLEFISHSGEYTAKDSEKIQYYLSGLETNVGICSTLSENEALHGFSTLAKALGRYYSAEHNDVMVQSVLYDGNVSADELEFVSALSADLNILLGTMLSDDGMSKKSDLVYEDIHIHLKNFLEKWGNWSWDSNAPYDLLNV